MGWASGYQVTRGWIGEVWILVSAVRRCSCESALHRGRPACLRVCLRNKPVLQQARLYAPEAERSGAGEGERTGEGEDLVKVEEVMTATDRARPGPGPSFGSVDR
jgi:hypothetical protein